MTGGGRRPPRGARDEGDEGERTVYGIHPVLEAITSEPAMVERVLVARERGGKTGRLFREARERGIPVSHVDRETLRRKTGAGSVHQGVAAVLSAVPYRRAADLVEQLRRAGPSGLLLAVDGVEDPRNLGAILRSAAAAGVQGALLGTAKTVGLTPAAVKTSAGAALRLPVARDPALPATLRSLAAAGAAVAVLVSRGGRPPEAVPGSGPVVLVAGGEERGARPAVREACPLQVTIPMAVGSDSLNVAVAVGVVLFEILRQRRGKDELD